MYEYELETGERYRNTGFIPVRDGRLAGTQVFSGAGSRSADRAHGLLAAVFGMVIRGRD
jgi:hypothetical protein